MRRTILDIHVEISTGMVHHATFADFPKRGAFVSTSREATLNAAMREIEWILLGQPKGMIVRLYDSYDMTYTDFQGKS